MVIEMAKTGLANIHFITSGVTGIPPPPARISPGEKLWGEGRMCLDPNPNP